MKNLLIIYPHWPPSNLAGVHRPRLIANFTKKFGWKSIVLTVASDYYDETPDPDMQRTVSPDVEVIYAKAFKSVKPKLIGDIGLRAMPFLYRAAIKSLKERKIDFIWIPIPSFYTALLGRILHERTGVLYGIDYIDPWVRDISTRQNLRSRLSLLAAKWLEPVAVKKASLISGVSEAYYKPVLERNFKKREIAHIAMPYGFDSHDHAIILDNIEVPWAAIEGCEPLVYAGAFLPNAHLFVDTLFKVVARMVAKGEWKESMHLYFLGTGNYTGTTIADYARRNGIGHLVHEVRGRFPYLHVLNFLSRSYAVMAIGSTEKHYTASKIFQALLSKRPVIGIFHEESSAVTIMQECNADAFLALYNKKIQFEDLAFTLNEILEQITLDDFIWTLNLNLLDKYSAKVSVQALVEKINYSITLKPIN